LATLLGPESTKGISVESTPDQGSTFSFTIQNKDKELQPLETYNENSPGEKLLETDELEIAPEPPLETSVISRLASTKSRTLINPPEVIKSASSCKCARVLIVDDDLFNIMAFESILTSLNISFESAYNGKKALEKLLKRKYSFCGKNCKGFSFVFMDKEMPGMDGVETVKEIRRLQAENVLPEMKIIGCTAHNGKEEIDNFMESRIDQCIHKPISRNVIQYIIQI